MSYDNNDNSDEELDSQLLIAGKEGIVFLVDATEPMFDLEQFSLAIGCVENVMKNKAIAQPSDETALILFGTDKTLNDESFDHMSVVNKMGKSSAKSILAIKDLNEENVRQKYGHNNQFSLAEVFSLAIKELNESKSKFQSKRVILFTSTSNPYPTDSKEEKLLRDIAIIRGKSFENYNIEFDLIPLASKDDKPFDIQVFYGDVFPHLKEEKFNTLVKFKQLLSRVYSRSFKQRVVASIPFHFGSSNQMNEELPEVKIAVNLYLLYSESKKPSPVILERPKESQNILSDDSMEVVSTQESKQTFSFGSESIQLTKTDDKAIKNFEDPALTLLGFKPRTALMSHIHLKPGFFIFPDESTIKGSTTLFSALLKRCTERDKIAICRFTLKYSTPPRLVALYPQIESKPLGKSGGFYLVYLPFKEDIRNPEIISTAQTPVSSVALDLAKNIVEKLSFNYDPNNFPNPVIQNHWRVIEGLALNLKSIDPFDDSRTQPDYLDIEEKAGYDLYNLNQTLGGYLIDSTEKKVKVYDDLSEFTRNNKLGALTVAELKEFCRKKKITCNNFKKAEVIEAIRSYYKSINK